MHGCDEGSGRGKKGKVHALIYLSVEYNRSRGNVLNLNDETQGNVLNLNDKTQGNTSVFDRKLASSGARRYINNSKRRRKQRRLMMNGLLSRV